MDGSVFEAYDTTRMIDHGRGQFENRKVIEPNAANPPKSSSNVVVNLDWIVLTAQRNLTLHYRLGTSVVHDNERRHLNRLAPVPEGSCTG